MSAAIEPAAGTTAAAEVLFVSTVRLARRLRQLSDTKLTPSQHSAMMSIQVLLPGDAVKWTVVVLGNVVEADERASLRSTWTS